MTLSGRDRAPNSDAGQWARLTGVHGTVWITLFGAVSALRTGARWLVA